MGHKVYKSWIRKNKQIKKEEGGNFGIWDCQKVSRSR